MPTALLEDNITDDLEATSLPEEEAAPDDEVDSEVEQEQEQPAPPPSKYGGKSDAEIDELIAAERRSAEAKARQSEIDRAAQAKFNADRQVAQSVLNGQAKQYIVNSITAHQRAVDEALRNGEDPPTMDPAWVDQVVAGLRRGLQNADTDEWVATGNAYVAEHAPRGWAPPQELVVKAAQSTAMYGKDGWLRASMEIAESIGIAKGIAQEQARRAEDDRIKGLENKNGRQPGPTGAGGSAPAAKNPREVINDAIVSEEDDRKNWAAALPGVPYPGR